MNEEPCVGRQAALCLDTEIHDIRNTNKTKLSKVEHYLQEIVRTVYSDTLLLKSGSISSALNLSTRRFNTMWPDALDK